MSEIINIDNRVCDFCAQAYYFDHGGNDRDYAKAFSLYKNGIEKNNCPECMFRLAVMFKTARGCKESLENYFRLLKQSAEKKFPNAVERVKEHYYDIKYHTDWEDKTTQYIIKNPEIYKELEHILERLKEDDKHQN